MVLYAKVEKLMVFMYWCLHFCCRSLFLNGKYWWKGVYIHILVLYRFEHAIREHSVPWNKFWKKMSPLKDSGFWTTNGALQICSIYECVYVEVDDVVVYHVDDPVDDTRTIDGKDFEPLRMRTNHIRWHITNMYITNMYACRWSDWLINWLIDLLIDWLTDWWIDWLIDWLIDRSVDRLIGWLIDS